MPSPLAFRASSRRALLALLCLLVLGAQQFALAHGVWHAVRDASGESRAVQSEPRPHAPEIAKLCDFDAAFGQFLTGTPTSQHAFVASPALAQGTWHRSRACTPAESLTPRSRGPPIRL